MWLYSFDDVSEWLKSRERIIVGQHSTYTFFLFLLDLDFWITSVCSLLEMRLEKIHFGHHVSKTEWYNRILLQKCELIFYVKYYFAVKEVFV